MSSATLPARSDICISFLCSWAGRQILVKSLCSCTFPCHIFILLQCNNTGQQQAEYDANLVASSFSTIHHTTLRSWGGKQERDAHLQLWHCSSQKPEHQSKEAGSLPTWLNASVKIIPSSSACLQVIPLQAKKMLLSVINLMCEELKLRTELASTCYK